MLQQIQFWKLAVNSDRSAVLVCERDSDDVAVTQEIPFTDFSLQSVIIYCQDGVLLYGITASIQGEDLIIS